MLNRRIILRDPTDGTTYRMEYSKGTIKATLSSGEKLFIPQQRFESQPPKFPTFNDHALELVEWKLGDTRWLNGREV
jgi:hypothetical protein